jgi:hypothetical protein
MACMNLDDIAYVRAEFRPLDAANAELVERGLLPRPTYVLPDGTPMVPETHGALLADGFRERFLAAGGPTTWKMSSNRG